MLSARGIVKHFGRVRALGGVDLDVAPGETVVIFGPNGSGKTTLLKICAGLLRPTAGRVTVNGGDPRAARGRIGYAGHDSYLYPHLTAAENLAFYARLYGVRDEEAEEMLERVGLGAKRGAPAGTLSRGQSQRLDLARALLHDPDLLLADEPFSGLDETSAGALPGLLARRGRSMLVATHDTDRGKAIADRILLLEGGRLVS